MLKGKKIWFKELWNKTRSRFCYSMAEESNRIIGWNIKKTSEQSKIPAIIYSTIFKMCVFFLFWIVCYWIQFDECCFQSGCCSFFKYFLNIAICPKKFGFSHRMECVCVRVYVQQQKQNEKKNQITFVSFALQVNFLCIWRKRTDFFFKIKNEIKIGKRGKK